jgi:hypothetical protein
MKLFASKHIPIEIVERKLHDNLIRPHHLVVLVFEEVAVPYVEEFVLGSQVLRAANQNANDTGYYPDMT